MADDKIDDILEAIKSKPPEPHEMAAGFDPGTWAAVQSLVLVLRRKGVLDQTDFTHLCDEMLKVRDKHAADGETQRAESVEIAEKDLALIAAPPGD